MFLVYFIIGKLKYNKKLMGSVLYISLLKHNITWAKLTQNQLTEAKIKIKIKWPLNLSQ